MKFLRIILAGLMMVCVLGATAPTSAAPAPVTSESVAAAINVPPCMFYNFSNMGIRTRIDRTLNGVSESQIVTVMPGEDVTGQDAWEWTRSAVADNHYAQINVVGFDGVSRWYNIWGPYTFNSDSKKKVIVSVYRYSSSPKHGVVEQVA